MVIPSTMAQTFPSGSQIALYIYSFIGTAWKRSRNMETYRSQNKKCFWLTQCQLDSCEWRKYWGGNRCLVKILQCQLDSCEWRKYWGGNRCLVKILQCQLDSCEWRKYWGGNRCLVKILHFWYCEKIYVDNAPQSFNRGDANGVVKIFTFVLSLMFKLSIYIYIFSFATVIFFLSINWGWFVFFLILNEEKFNQWTGFYMITASVMKKLKIFLEKKFFKCEKCGNKGPWCETSLLYFEITSRGKLH